MSIYRELADPGQRYAHFCADTGSTRYARDTVHQLGIGLAAGVREQLTGSGPVLCVVILRGGALLYPSFVEQFRDADYSMLGLRRTGSLVRCDYRTAVPGEHYRYTVYLDCVAATGNTVLTARTAIQQDCSTGTELAAVLSSSAPASRVLGAAGIGLIGYSLQESVEAGVVSPDLGELDAGDLFSSAQSAAATTSSGSRR